MSYILVDSKKVIKACNTWLEAYDSKKLEAVNEIVDKLANTRLWNFKKMGQEKAMQRLMQGKAGMQYQIPFDCRLCSDSDNYKIVKRLLVLAKHGDPVVITDNHYFIFEET